MVKEKDSPAGTDKDLNNMEAAFKSLDFAVVKIRDISQLDLSAVVKAAANYPYVNKVPSCTVIAFYYAGHGESKDRKPYVIVKDGKECFVEEIIVSQFYPKNAPDLKNIKRLFFFDMCVGDELHRGIDRALPAKKPEMPQAIPAVGNCLVAFANSIGFKSRGTAEDGGYWTRNLCKYITQDLDIFLVLAKAWEDTVRDTFTPPEGFLRNVQGPHLTACMGCLNLYGKLY